MSRSSYLSLSFWHSHQNPIPISLIPHTSSCPAHLTLLDMIIFIMSGEKYKLWSGVLSNLLLIPLRSKYSPQHPVLKYPQSIW
jgi:hypothetical protein